MQLRFLAVASTAVLFCTVAEAGAPFTIPLLGGDPGTASEPILVPATGMSGNVSRVAVSADGRFVAAKNDDYVKVWDRSSNTELGRLIAARDPKAIGFTDDGALLYVVHSAKGTATVARFDTKTWASAGTFDVPGHVTGAAAIKGGTLLVLAFYNGVVKIVDLKSGEVVRTLQTKGDGWRDAFASADGERFAVHLKKQILLYRADASGPYREVNVPFAVSGVDFLGKDDELVFTVYGEKKGPDSLVVWDTATGAQVSKVAFKHKTDKWRGTNMVVATADGRYAVTYKDGLSLYDFEAKRWIDAGFTPKKGKLTLCSAAISKDGSTLIIGEYQGLVRAWSLPEIQLTNTFAPRHHYVDQPRFSSTGRYVYTRGSQSVRVWDLATASQRFSFDIPKTDWRIASYGISPDETKIVVSAGSETLEDKYAEFAVYSLQTGVMLNRFRAPLGWHRRVAFTSDGLIAASGYPPEGPKAYGLFMIDPATGKITGQWTDLLSKGIWGMAFGPKGARAAVAGADGESGYHARLLDKHGKVLHRLRHPTAQRAMQVAFSPDGKRLAVTWCKERPDASDKNESVHIYDAANGTQVAGLLSHDGCASSVSYSRDGKFLVVGDDRSQAKVQQELSVFDASTYKLVKTLPKVRHGAFSPDGNTLFTTNQDRTAALWDWKSATPKAIFYGIDKAAYMISTPAKDYTASHGALGAIAFRIDNQGFPFEQFDLRLNRPHVVLEALGQGTPELIAAYRLAYEKRLKRSGYKESDLKPGGALPTLKIASKDVPKTTTKAKITIPYEAKDEASRLRRLDVFVNDVPVFGKGGVNLAKYKSKKRKGEVDVELAAGPNKIQVVVRNARGSASLKQTFHVFSKRPVGKPNLYVLSIGVSQYRQSQFNLNYAAKDAKDVALGFADSKAFGMVHKLEILDEAVTKASVKKAKKFLEKAKVDDLVVVFLAGHGVLDDKYDYYFGTSDIDFNAPEERGLPYDAIDGLLDGLRAQKKMLLMDTCHSGEVDEDDAILVAARTVDGVKARAVSTRGLKKRPKSQANGLKRHEMSELLSRLFADLRRGSGATIISSSGGAEFAYESSDWSNGVFTFSLLEGMKTRKADRDGDSKLRVSELQTYLIERVGELTRGGQTPTVRRYNRELDFWVH